MTRIPITATACIILLSAADGGRAKIPPGTAGSLSGQEYADIVAGILKGKGIPTCGDKELSADGVSTSDIRITWNKP